MNGQTKSGEDVDPTANGGIKGSSTKDADSVNDNVINIEENGVNDEVQGSKSNNQPDLTSYWTKMTNGPSGKIIKIKKEKMESQNRFNAFNEVKEQDENKNEIEDEKVNENESDLGDIYGVEDDFSREEDIAMYPQLAKDAMSEIVQKDIEKLEHHVLSETMFVVMRCKNHKLTRSEVYTKETKWLKKALGHKMEQYLDHNFNEKMKVLAMKIKMLDTEDYDNDDEINQLVHEVYTVSKLEIASLSHMEIKNKFIEIRETIKLIDDFLADPLTMVPKKLVNLRECTKKELDGMNYFQMVMAVIYEKGEGENILQLNQNRLYKKALELRAFYSKESRDAGGSQSKKSKHTATNNGMNEATNATNATHKSKVEQVLEGQRADRRQQGQNLNGINVSDLTPKRKHEHTNFDLPPPSDTNNNVIKQQKTVYWIHNKIHIKDQLHAPTLVKMLVRMLRKADPSVLILPLQKTSSQNDTIENEEYIPEEEQELQKWIGIARYQPNRKFAFSMRIAITENPGIVRGRIFQWCREHHHFVEFKEITSENIISAGWLYGIHNRFHNRDSLRKWMVHQNPALNNSIHLLPSKLFGKREDEKGTKVISYGVKVEIKYENREEIYRVLYNLKWEDGPYKNSIFVPFMETDAFTENMQLKFLNKQNQYLTRIRQKVFRMKGPEWEIPNKKTGEITTFKKWILNFTVNNQKIIESFEIGNNDYVRILFFKEKHKEIKFIMRKLHETTKENFGDETDKLFSVENGPMSGSLYELEDNYASKLSAVLGSNPQMDEQDVAKPVQGPKKQRVYFHKQVKSSYSSVVQNTQSNKDVKNMDEKMDQKMDELRKEIMESVDIKVDKLDQKISVQMTTLKEDHEQKLEELTKKIDDNYAKSESAAYSREAKADLRFETLVALIQNQKPPVALVEHGSHEGGGQK